MKNLIIATSVCLILSQALTGNLLAQKKRKDTKPNLIVIQTDEHNFRTLGCYRELLSEEQANMWGKGNVVQTPNIDDLAEKGMVFDKFYAATPVCSPSRGSLMSGMYPQNSGVVHNDQKPHTDIISYSQVLADNGYQTAFVGKWHLNGYDKPGWAPQPNFGFIHNKYMFNRGHWKQLDENEDGPFVIKNKEGKISYSIEGADERTFTTDFLTNKSIDFIKANKEQPFSIYISYPDPHGPDMVRAPYNTMYNDMDFEAPATFNKTDEGVPSWAAKQKGNNISQSQYYGMIKCIDDNIGKLINMLKEEDLLDNTIIVFTADHGDLRGEHHRQNKSVPLEASAKVPFIVYYPSQVPAGTVIKNAFGTADFAPSILSFMGYEIPEKMEGQDFSPLLTKPKNQKKWRDITFVRNTQDNNVDKGWVAAITSRYKLVLSSEDEPWLIDMESDPHELINFIQNPDNSKIVKELAMKLDEYGKSHNDPFLLKGKMRQDLNKLINL